MNGKLRAALIYSAKNAVNAVLVTVPTLGIAPKAFHFHDKVGVEHILLEMGAAVVAREVSIWLPKVLAWSQTPPPDDSNPSAPALGGSNVAVSAVKG